MDFRGNKIFVFFSMDFRGNKIFVFFSMDFRGDFYSMDFRGNKLLPAFQWILEKTTFCLLFNGGQLLFLLHSEWPKFDGVLAILSATWLRDMLLRAVLLLKQNPFLKDFYLQGSKQNVTEVDVVVVLHPR